MPRTHRDILPRLLLVGSLAVMARSAPAEPPEAAPEPDAEAAAATLEADLQWPRLYEKDGHTVVMHQPQIERWDDYELIVVTAAIAVLLDGDDEPHFGSMKVVARTSIDFDSRRVLFGRREIRGMLFPDVDPNTFVEIRRVVPKVLAPSGPLVMTLDEIVAYLDLERHPVPETIVSVQPPPIFHREHPALLVCLRGKPHYARVPGTFMVHAVNTAWTLLLDPGQDRYYLLDGASWLTTGDLFRGPWEAAGTLPEDLALLPDDAEWGPIRATIPGATADPVPDVIVAREPAELIVTDGPPEREAIPGTQLAWVTNTDADLFVHEPDGAYYFLAAGRWFRAPTLDGPWSAATADLPEDFARIPHDHPRAEVLVSVPGTPDAEAAVLLASIPRKATVLREGVTIDVPYDGEPSFREIDGADGVAFADNTPFDVFRIDGSYFCCHHGVWFTATAPTGPWAVSIKVPEAIDSIPSTSPKHDVTYVRVYDSDDATVTVGQTSGYAGQYVAGGLLVFGIGYAIANADDASFYLSYGNARPPAYGGGVRYDSYRGRYAHAVAARGPYAGAVGWAAYDPRSGTYRRGVAGATDDRVAVARSVHDPDTGRYAARARGANPYGSWGRSVIVDDDGNWARSGHRTGPGGTVAGVETSGGSAAIGREDRRGNRSFLAHGDDGDLYVGRNGSVYSRDGAGNWQQRGRGGWREVSPDGASAGDLRSLDRKARSRRLGQQRARGHHDRRSRPGGRGRRR